MDRNKRFAELVRVRWYPADPSKPPEDDWVFCGGKIWGALDNPDYAADPRLVLRVMMKREDWRDFAEWAFNGDYQTLAEMTLDTTGKLRDKAIEWLEGRKE